MKYTRQLQRNVGQHRNHCVAQHVGEQHAVFANAFGARSANVVLVDLVEEKLRYSRVCGASETNTARLTGSTA